MACKKPVIATAVGGIPEIIENGVNGVLLKKNSPDIIADAIIDVLKNSQRQKTMGELARETVSCKFSWSTNLQKYERFYEDVLVEQ
jgi:glycosyltransferase involved in cell wall biosynthesis